VTGLRAKGGQFRKLRVTVIQPLWRDPLYLFQVRRMDKRSGTQINSLGFNLEQIARNQGVVYSLITVAPKWHLDHPMVTSPAAPSIWVRCPPTHTPLTYWPSCPSGTGSASGGGDFGGLDVTEPLTCTLVASRAWVR
jgi:hypothetical protein